MLALHLSLAGLWGGLLSLERRAFLQAMFSRPLVAATGTGMLLEDAESGLYVGLVGPLNLGNVHAGPLRHPVSRTVFLTESEKEQLEKLSKDGLAVTIQTVPNEPAQRL